MLAKRHGNSLSVLKSSENNNDSNFFDDDMNRDGSGYGNNSNNSNADDLQNIEILRADGSETLTDDKLLQLEQGQPSQLVIMKEVSSRSQ